MIDGRGRVWKRNEDGNFCVVSRDEYRDMFMLRRKKLTYKAIGDRYKVCRNHARTLVKRYQRHRRVKVYRYLEIRNKRINQDEMV